MTSDHAAFGDLLKAIASDDDASVYRLLAALPALAQGRVEVGATRLDAKPHHLDAIGHYVYAGDTALHVCAAAHRPEVARRLLSLGADVRARNRRGAEPLHYAADGLPGSPRWDAGAQAATVAVLLEAGADPNAVDRSGVTPLHRAVRTRCAAAVSALLAGGADARRANGNGSTPMLLATRQSGRGGAGSPDAKAQQAEIVRLLERHGAAS
ncbi:ankyrin repeat domain-containing protein [Phenylobacterium sp.]|uniref:ankyrin repeat domain-containing protein n=1 Tax=Phenylobacterium sp. TaxID=1871053 RepID=UPI003564470A